MNSSSWCFPLKEVSPQDCLLIPKINYRTFNPEKLSSWPPVCLLLASQKPLHFWGVLTLFLCFRSGLANEAVLYRTVRLDSKIRFQNVHFHHSFWRKQNFAAAKLFLSLTRIDFAARLSSKAVRVFPALSLRRVRPSYGTFFLLVLQGHCARGRTGHMIMINKPRENIFDDAIWVLIIL